MALRTSMRSTCVTCKSGTLPHRDVTLFLGNHCESEVSTGALHLGKHRRPGTSFFNTSTTIASAGVSPVFLPQSRSGGTVKGKPTAKPTRFPLTRTALHCWREHEGSHEAGRPHAPQNAWRLKPRELPTAFFARRQSRCVKGSEARVNQYGPPGELIPGAAMASAESDPVRHWITTEGGATQITRIWPIGGGCINDASRYDTDVGPFFVKINRNEGPSMFAAEQAGLEAMHNTGTIRVPRPYKVGPLPRRGSYIIMEYIQFGASNRSQAVLGEQLAEMHLKGSTDRGFGFHMDNTIGSTPQHNPWTKDWVEFFRVHRLGFQLSLAQQQYNDQDIYVKGQRLLEKLPEIFSGVHVQPVLLHGDLWSGNISADVDGNPVILDPACYYGHSEAEFGMSWCASFSPSFYNAYFKVIPKQPGFETRVELYKLYHYLNHYNLFGSGYRSSCMSIIKQFV
ncbi:hypothetical protein CBR_g38943 [Chara braunii]|uniref:Protein-ribulosamine 3-kinase, chloroplastic n=1 Tax=Chara braunii TaxID=69332 RepID=A0A388K0R5_CHABU|nr:hypothetical protein CBR_g38943 [Chara braunii]|eukprot:GBG63632.1 hypothetical protein CBR_g38943 [Chara braunii]